MVGNNGKGSTEQTRKCLQAHTIVANSFSILFSALFNILLAQAIDIFCPIFASLNIAPTANQLASVVSMIGLVKSANCNTGSVVRSYFSC